MRKLHSAILFVGLPGSGKSTYFRENFAHSHLPVSLDVLKTRSKEARIFNAALIGKADFVIDNTNCSRKERERYMKVLLDPKHRPNWAIDCYYFDEDVDDCLKRNRQRSEKNVPPVAIYSAHKRLETPSYDEGFDNIYTIRLDCSIFNKKLRKKTVKL